MIKNKRTGETSHEGQTISPSYRGNQWLYSDYGIGVYCEVWDGEAVREIMVGAYDCPGEGIEDEVTVDATAEVLAAVEIYRAHIEAQQMERARVAQIEAEWLSLREVRRGRIVKVVKGRKVPVGTVAQVFWYGDTRYGTRLGLKVRGSNEALWTAISNVEVILPEVLAA